MAQLLAPYNNSMRLGQGFNSYTQQICLDKAVSPDNKPLPAQRTTEITIAEPIEIEKDYDDAAVQSATDSTGDGPEDNTSDKNAQRLAAVGDDKAYKPRPFVVQPWVTPQIVTYSSTFVDKISDITDSMNISGALEVKTQQVSGGISGSYINSDQFKSSDLNFHIQVKVTNQVHQPPEYALFNQIDSVTDLEFNDIYGDTFISGWELGGEMNAVISVKVLDKSKILDVKAHLEGELNGPSLSGKVSADFGMADKKLNKETETTISINWSGGGSIKHPSEEWNIGSLKRAAAGFPELVAITPQRTYAVLTKYQLLSDFQTKRKNFSPILYENAGIYTKYLLDSYMDYKVMWKQITSATDELEVNRATIETAQPWEDICKLAKIKPMPPPPPKKQTITDSGSGGGDASQQSKIKSTGAVVSSQNTNDQEFVNYPIFPPTFAGLIKARKICRFEMAKIVQEVDIVAKDPNIATDQERDEYLLDPLVFKQLLPIVRSISPQSAALGVTNPNAALLLGYLQPQDRKTPVPSLFRLETDLKAYGLHMEQSVTALRHKADDYRMQGCAGINGRLHTRAKWFNDLEKLDATYRPTRFLFWQVGDWLKGIKVQYASGEDKSHGNCSGDPSHTLALVVDGSETIIEILTKEAPDEKNVVGIVSMSLATSFCNTLDTSISPSQIAKDDKDSPVKSDGNPMKGDETAATTKDAKSSSSEKSESSAPGTENEKAAPATPESQKTGKTVAVKEPKWALDPKTVRIRTWVLPSDQQWTLRGFFGSTHNDVFPSLGFIWGKDGFLPVPQKSPKPALCKHLLSLSPDSQGEVKRHAQLGVFAENFFMGDFATTKAGDDDKVKHFNALEQIDLDWKIKNIAFAAADTRLTGLKVTYQNGQEIEHGIYTPETEVWQCNTKSDLLIVKITAGKTVENQKAYVDTMEFVRADSDGNLPNWPLDFSTMRYLGVGEERVSKEVSELVERAPRDSRGRWTIRGFYGEHDRESINKLGVVWGQA